jgi:FkbM family methyltransferase
MWAGAYEPELVSLLKKTLKPGMTVLDLGANIGYFSVIAAALVGENGQVHAFEPMPQNLGRLRKNLAPFLWATVHPYAVGNVMGEVAIHYNEKEAGWASIHDQHRLGNLPCNSVVSAIRLDDWLQSISINRIDFIKLDIEVVNWMPYSAPVKRCPIFIPQLLRRPRAVGTTTKSVSCLAPQAINVVLFAGTPSWAFRALNRWHAS